MTDLNANAATHENQSILLRRLTAGPAVQCWKVSSNTHIFDKI